MDQRCIYLQRTKDTCASSVTKSDMWALLCNSLFNRKDLPIDNINQRENNKEEEYQSQKVLELHIKDC